MYDSWPAASVICSPVSLLICQYKCSNILQAVASIHGPVQAAHGDLLSNAIPLLDKRLLGSLCGGERGVKCKQDAHKEGETAHHHENEMRPKDCNVLCKELKAARVTLAPESKVLTLDLRDSRSLAPVSHN